MFVIYMNNWYSYYNYINTIKTIIMPPPPSLPPEVQGIQTVINQLNSFGKDY